MLANTVEQFLLQIKTLFNLTINPQTQEVFYLYLLL